MLKSANLIRSAVFILAAVLIALDASADSAQTSKEEEPFIEAARNGDEGAVRYYLKKGISPHTQDKAGQTAMMVGAAMGYSGIVDAVLNAGGRVNKQDSFGRTALSWAASRGHIDIVESLLDRGADINVQTKDGMTPLMLAVKEAHPVVVQILLDRKPDMERRDYTGRNALGWARDGRDRRIERMLRRAGARD